MLCRMGFVTRSLKHEVEFSKTLVIDVKNFWKVILGTKEQLPLKLCIDFEKGERIPRVDIFRVFQNLKLIQKGQVTRKLKN